MKRPILLFLLLLPTLLLEAQTVDTLSNIPIEGALYAPRYTNPGQWGYVLGQSSTYRQQFAEKYYLDGPATVNGMIAHLTGVFEHPTNYVEFNVYQVAPNGLPGKRLGGKQVFYKDLNLSGEAMMVTLNTPIAVQDSFFVTFNVLDYLHGGFEGDTLGLLAGEPGSRSEEDLVNFGRNAVQAHNHAREDWKDFYSQNFTPLAIHFALFPVVESDAVTALPAEEPALPIQVYPNPAHDRLYLPLSDSYETITVYNLMGKAIYQKSGNEAPNTIYVGSWAAGSYLIRVQAKNGRHFFKKIIIR